MPQDSSSDQDVVLVARNSREADICRRKEDSLADDDRDPCSFAQIQPFLRLSESSWRWGIELYEAQLVRYHSGYRAPVRARVDKARVLNHRVRVEGGGRPVIAGFRIAPDDTADGQFSYRQMPGWGERTVPIIVFHAPGPPFLASAHNGTRHLRGKTKSAGATSPIAQAGASNVFRMDGGAVPSAVGSRSPRITSIQREFGRHTSSQPEDHATETGCAYDFQAWRHGLADDLSGCLGVFEGNDDASLGRSLAAATTAIAIARSRQPEAEPSFAGSSLILTF